MDTIIGIILTSSRASLSFSFEISSPAGQDLPIPLSALRRQLQQVPEFPKQLSVIVSVLDKVNLLLGPIISVRRWMIKDSWYNLLC
jgi:hypothetical protein